MLWVLDNTHKYHLFISNPWENPHEHPWVDVPLLFEGLCCSWNHLLETVITIRHPPQVKVKVKKPRCRDEKSREVQTKAEPGSPDSQDKTLSCCHCSFNTTSSLLLGLHMHTHKGGKPYHCPICLKKFSCAHDHSRHLQTHTGEKPFSCPYCPLRFNQKCNMTYHIETCHPHEYVIYRKGLK